MKWITRLFVTIITASVLISFAVCVQAVSNMQTSLEHLNETLELIEGAMEDAYDEAINESLVQAPEGLSIYQLRGNAQKEAQRLLDKITDERDLPRYELNTIRFRGTLRDGAAGTASNCEDEDGVVETSFTISLNEILFLRNYEDFIHIIIPHEVAHVVTCLSGGFDWNEKEESMHRAAHGEEWFQVMKELGFPEPQKYVTHDLDMLPVYLYKNNLAKKVDEALNRHEKEEHETE